ncbi:MAG: hypothetical protein ABL933_16520 [Methyloglobulus sp.]|nr:hypothetical protein [Methyloglobulus sp.]
MLNKMFFKEVLIATTLLAASGYTVMAQAHCLNNQTITNNSNNFQWDTYVAVCPAGTTGLSGRISKQAGTGSVSMEIGKGTFAHTTASDATITASSCDAVTGNITAAASAVTVPTVNGGPGQYTIMVSKNSSNSHTYDMEWHCVNNDAPEGQDDPAVEIQNINNH